MKLFFFCRNLIISYTANPPVKVVWLCHLAVRGKFSTSHPDSRPYVYIFSRKCHDSTLFSIIVSVKGRNDFGPILLKQFHKTPKWRVFLFDILWEVWVYSLKDRALPSYNCPSNPQHKLHRVLFSFTFLPSNLPRPANNTQHSSFSKLIHGYAFALLYQPLLELYVWFSYHISQTAFPFPTVWQAPRLLLSTCLSWIWRIHFAYSGSISFYLLAANCTKIMSTPM